MALENYASMLEQFDPLKIDQQIATTQGLQQKNKLGNLELAEKQREISDRQTESDVWRNALDRNGNIDQRALETGYAQKGLGSKIPDIQKTQAEIYNKNATATKALRDADKSQLEQRLIGMKTAAAIIGPVKDQQTWELARQQTAELFGPDAAAKMPAQYDPALVDQKRKQAMTIEEQLSQEWKQKNYDLDVNKFRYQQENDERDRAVKLRGQNITVRGQDLVNARAAEAGNVPEYKQDADGNWVALPKKVTSGATITAQPVIGADGKPLGGKMKDIPSSVNTAIVSNAQSIKKIDDALTLLSGGKVGDMSGDKAATGWKGYVPNAALNRVDPNGTDTRAAISDIGSLILHDRSGAAVTASESPRLLPFIPLSTDDPATARKKLNRFKQIYQDEARALGETYSKEQGYRPNPVLERSKKGGDTAAGIPADIADLLKKHGG